eukprot:TRINITY_DN17716_c0_g1_i3.p2 TRINITY_DN17716_c0_g1~~TRINITY_DN17716_c0_g1_i3.p2  ORF type:complete len:109 (-),score=23.17 TRINITY_DN17716_c0_g1_i3:5-331(-)
MGTYWYKDQSKYTGNWFDDHRDGKGKLLLPNGDIYDGNWTNDQLEGNALFFTPEKGWIAVSYTHLRAHETSLHLVCRLLLEKKKNKTQINEYSVRYIYISTHTRQKSI